MPGLAPRQPSRDRKGAGPLTRTTVIAFGLSLAGCQSPSAQPTKPTPPPPSTPASPPVPAPAPRPSPTPPPAQAPTRPALRDLFPHIRADLSAKLVEFDGTVPIDCHNPRTPNVYLEVVACIPDTKEHETLVVTPAKPSHIHAALLAVGLQPGQPATWKWEDKKLTSFPPRGDPVLVTIAYRDSARREIESPATDWIINAETKAPFAAPDSPARWLFAGSVLTERQGREVYDADGSGVLIGLTTFGSETIAWSRVISPDAEVQEPEWIANAAKVPKAGTPVVVRIRPAKPGP